jgi:hypothetical protein
MAFAWNFDDMSWDMYFIKKKQRTKFKYKSG